MKRTSSTSYLSSSTASAVPSQRKIQRLQLGYSDLSQPAHSESRAYTARAQSNTLLASFSTELLARIFRALPWPDRVRMVERVCKRWRKIVLEHGWLDLAHFSSYKFYKAFGEPSNFNNLMSPAAWVDALLTRIGHRLTSASLQGDMSSESSNRVLRAQLEKCPDLKHLSVSRDVLSLDTVHYIRRTYSPALKSLSLISCPMSYAAAVASFNEALSHDFASLECLCLDELSYEVITKLRFSPVSLANLNVLSIRCWDACWYWPASLGKGLCELAQLPALRSFTFSIKQQSIDLSFLRDIPHLQHLCIMVNSAATLDTFASALWPNLARSLKALEVSEVYSSRIGNTSSLVGRIVELIANNLHQLEHLGISSIDRTKIWGMENLMDWLAPLAEQLGKLRSLELRSNIPWGVDWGWLESMDCLEYLSISQRNGDTQTEPPIGTLCNIVRKCKQLHTLKLPKYTLLAWDMKAIIAAASDEGGDEETTNNHRTGLLRVGAKEINDIPNAPSKSGRCLASPNGASRFSFHRLENEYVGLASPILQLHQYGALSKGKPEFI